MTRNFIFLSWPSGRPGRRLRLLLHFMPHFLLLPLVSLPCFLLARLHPLSLVGLRHLSTSPRQHELVLHRPVLREPASPALETLRPFLLFKFSSLEAPSCVLSPRSSLSFIDSDLRDLGRAHDGLIAKVMNMLSTFQIIRVRRVSACIILTRGAPHRDPVVRAFVVRPVPHKDIPHIPDRALRARAVLSYTPKPIY